MREVFEKPCLVVNPSAGNGEALKLTDSVLEKLKASWPNTDGVVSKQKGDLAKITQEQIQKGASLIIGLGGDGTIHEIINVLGEHSQAPLAILPCGFGNDTARSLGLSHNLDSNIIKLISGKINYLDLGQIINQSGRKYFVNIASCGLSAEIAKNMRSNQGNYYLETLKTLWSYKAQDISMVIDNKSIQLPNNSLLAFANGRYFGKGMQIAPNACMNDGRFDGISVSNIGLGFFLRHGHKVYKGKHLDLPQVYKWRGQKALVESNSLEKIYIEADGEDMGCLPAEFKVIPKALPILI